jgi:plastocyanin
MLSRRLVLLCTFLVFSAACGSTYSSTPPSPVPSTPGATSQVSIRMGAEVLGDQAYAPDTLNVAVGDAVAWTNADSVAHTSTSDGNGWNSGVIAPGQGFSTTFQASGTYRYHCAIHPGMVGTVVVR